MAGPVSPVEEAERWVAAPGMSGYEVSDRGRVRSLDRKIVRSDGVVQRWPGRLLRPRVRESGHLHVMGSDRRNYRVHRLVLEAFVGPCPADGHEACHNDGNPSNNRLENLRWDTRKANAQDTLRHGRNHQRSKTHCPRNHILAAPNLRTDAWATGRGVRGCLACARAHGHCSSHPEADFLTVADQFYAEIIREADR
jgi:hypothetical protein